MELEVIDTEAIDYSKYTIHIVDDSKVQRCLLEEVLQKKNYIINSSTNGKEALESILDNIPDLIILDVEMPIMDGYETIKHLKNNKKTSHIPVIFLTGLTKPDVIKNLFDLGAADYIPKPFVNEEILARIEKEIKSIMLQNILKEKMSKLAELLSTDTLTKTYNKMYMTSIINTKVELLKTDKNATFSLIYLDIDNFNSFVKTNGISASDSAIKRISMIIKRFINNDVPVSHWYGDTFMILFPKNTKTDPDSAAKEIRDHILKAPFESNVHLGCTISILEVPEYTATNKIIERLQNSMRDVKKVNKGSIVKAVFS